MSWCSLRRSLGCFVPIVPTARRTSGHKAVKAPRPIQWGEERKYLKMAKSKTATGHGPDTIVVEIPAGLALTYGQWSIDAATASAATLAYCLQNGFHQSMVDAAAFSKEDKDGKSDSEVEAMAVEKRNVRFDNIVAGTVGHRAGGPRAKGIDLYIREIADKLIAAKAAEKGAKLPSGKGAAEKMAAFRERLLAVPHVAADIRAKAEAAMAADKALASEVELDFAS